MSRTRRFALVAAAILGSVGSAPSTAQEARLAGTAAAVHLGTFPKSPEWGTGGVTFYNVGASEFLPKDSISTYGTFVSPAGRYATSSGAFFQATPHIPGGALLTSMELDYCDDDPNDSLALSLYDCDYLGICNQLAFLQTSIPTNVCSGYLAMDLTPLAYTVNNDSRRLYLEISPGSGGIDKTFYGAILGYKLQVSQPPGSPTFNDVPTNDLGYQYVEALSASGITGGCGGGNYCPDSPVTRRQMAIFIAKALGLSWSGY